MFSTDDDEDFAPAVNSKLASLFGQPVEEGNASLTYTAPKQPKKNRPENASPATASPVKLSIIAVQAVQAFKLERGNYINQGKLGAALLGNVESKVYQLLLYKNKQQHITTTKITDKFQFTVQAQNYVSFYDDRGQNWSLMFESESNAVDFARQVGLSRACVPSERGELPFYTQDLKIGEGPGSEIGDLLEIRYTTLPFVNGKLERVIESNVNADKPQRVNIRKGVWEEALFGASKGCKRLIVLAAILFGPWKPLADANHRLVVEVEIGRIKKPRKSQESTPVDLLNCPDSSESNVDSSTDETSIKARGASISEALTNSPKTHKASIISRMARMGQATLPLRGAQAKGGSRASNASDSEETEEESSGVAMNVSLPAKSALKPRTLSMKRSAAAAQSSASTGPAPATAAPTGSKSVPAHHMSVFQAAPIGWHPQNSQQYLINGVPINFPLPDSQLFASPHQQVVAVPAVVPTPTTTPSSDSHLSLYLSESRTHNAELRMGLTKVADKVDLVLGKLDTLQHPPVVGVLEPRTLLASIQKLVLENEQLQAELTDKRSKMEQQNEKMYQLLHQKFLEQSSSASAVDPRPDASLHTVILELQQEKAKLITDLNDAVTKINTFQEEIAKLEKYYNEKLNEALKSNSDCGENYTHLNDIKKLEMENIELISQVLDLKDQLKSSSNSSIGDVKRVMNVMFKLLKSEFVPGTSYDGSAVRETMLTSIQHVTHQYVQVKSEAIIKIDSDKRVTHDKIKIISTATEPSTHNQENTDDSVKILENSEKSNDDKTPVTSNINEMSDEHINKNTTVKHIDGEENSAMSNVSMEQTPKVIEPETQFYVDGEENETKGAEGNKEKLNIENGKEQTLGSNLQAEKTREPSVERGWRPQPPPSPLFDDEEDDDDWLS